MTDLTVSLRQVPNLPEQLTSCSSPWKKMLFALPTGFLTATFGSQLITEANSEHPLVKKSLIWASGFATITAVADIVFSKHNACSAKTDLEHKFMQATIHTTAIECHYKDESKSLTCYTNSSDSRQLLAIQSALKEKAQSKKIKELSIPSSEPILLKTILITGEIVQLSFFVICLSGLLLAEKIEELPSKLERRFIDPLRGKSQITIPITPVQKLPKPPSRNKIPGGIIPWSIAGATIAGGALFKTEPLENTLCISTISGLIAPTIPWLIKQEINENSFKVEDFLTEFAKRRVREKDKVVCDIFKKSCFIETPQFNRTTCLPKEKPIVVSQALAQRIK